MNRMIIATAALAAVLASVAAAPAATSASTAVRAPYVDKRVNACEGPRPGCNPGAVAHYWYKRGSASRGVGWVYASHEGVRSGTARWLVKKPGGAWKTGGGWKRAKRIGSFVEVGWGKDGHTGPKYPKNSRICVQFKSLAEKACVTLK